MPKGGNGGRSWADDAKAASSIDAFLEFGLVYFESTVGFSRYILVTLILHVSTRSSGWSFSRR